MERQSLARGMIAELDHVKDDDAVGFALGCLWSAIGWFLTTADGVIRCVRMAILLASGALALLGLLTVAKLRGSGSPLTLWSLTAISVFYAGAAVLSVWRGLGALSLYAIVGLALNTMAFLAQRSPAFEAEPGSVFLRALAIEQFGLLILLLGVGIGARGLAARLRG